VSSATRSRTLLAILGALESRIVNIEFVGISRGGKSCAYAGVHVVELASAAIGIGIEKCNRICLFNTSAVFVSANFTIPPAPLDITENKDTKKQGDINGQTRK